MAVVLVVLAAPAGLAATANASGWKSPSLSICDGSDRWQAFGFGYQKPQYGKDAGGFVHLRGSVACAAAPGDNTQLFVLPKGFRPFQDEAWKVASGTGGGTFDSFARVYVSRSGEVVFDGFPEDPSGAFVSLSGIEFAQTRWTAASLKPCAPGISWRGVASKVGFVRDSDGVVHLRGWAGCNSLTVSGHVIFRLPRADRPAKVEIFTVYSNWPHGATVVAVDPNGTVTVGGNVGQGPAVSLSGISFNAAGARTSGTWRTPKLSPCDIASKRWRSFGFGYQGPRFRMDSRGFVHFSGAVACPGTPTSSVLFKLPSRLAPPAKEVFPIATSDGSGNYNVGAVIQVDPNGTVEASGNYNYGFISLSAIEFATG